MENFVNANVAVLKKQFEQLFPGKWLAGGDADRILRTGINEIDSGFVSGFARRRINQWTGLPSCGKLTLLRGAVAYWCSNGLHVAYVDTFSRLLAGDWAFVQEGCCGSVELNLSRRNIHSLPARTDLSGVNKRGQFFVARVSEVLEEANAETRGKQSEKDIRKEAYWVTEQIIRSAVFDVVILDLAEIWYLPSQMYARLQRSLDRSKSTLIILKDEPINKIEAGRKAENKNERAAAGKNDQIGNNGWGCHTNVHFKWAAPIHFENGINGVASILPSIHGVISRDGLTHDMEVRLISNVQNRLFTHPQIPDRRTSKTRARA